MMTIPADEARRIRHTKAALGHVYQAVAYTERMAAANPGSEIVEKLYTDRSELKKIAETLDALIGREAAPW